MIAHTFLSFGFGDDHLAIFIEARKEATEGYSSIKEFFKQYELIYIVGDERDLIRVRTNYRKDPLKMCTSTDRLLQLETGGGCCWIT